LVVRAVALEPPRHLTSAAIVHPVATIRWHQNEMNRYFLKFKWTFLCLASVSLSACAGKTAGEHLADMPQWMGGEPAGVPPRRGTPEYDAWMAARAQEAARSKAEQPQKTDQPK